MNKSNQLEIFNLENGGAIFSQCRNYRFVLWRIWEDSLPKVMFIGLNPSTANEKENDPTIRRVISFARNWGFGGVYMLNLFTYITSYPKELKKCNDPILLADGYLQLYAKKVNKIIFAFGAYNEAKERADQVIKMFPAGEALMKNKDGSPRHPLYVPGNIKPSLYEKENF